MRTLYKNYLMILTLHGVMGLSFFTYKNINTPDDTFAATILAPSFPSSSHEAPLKIDGCTNRGIELASNAPMPLDDRREISVMLRIFPISIDQLGEYSLCGATFISPTQLITAAHCVQNTNRIEIEIISKTENKKTFIAASFWTSAYNYNKKRDVFHSVSDDVALVHISPIDAAPAWAQLSQSGAGSCDRINWVGHGSSLLNTAKIGERRLAANTVNSIITNRDQNGDKRRMLLWNSSLINLAVFHEAVVPGDSGSGVFDEFGRLVGVVSARSVIPEDTREIKDNIGFLSIASDLSDPIITLFLSEKTKDLAMAGGMTL
jgi:V8-like Glu-specific endopeptidase